MIFILELMNIDAFKLVIYIYINKYIVRTPTQCHIDLACNTSYHFAASRTVSPRCRLTFARDRLRILAHVYDGVASIHMIKSPG